MTATCSARRRALLFATVAFGAILMTTAATAQTIPPRIATPVGARPVIVVFDMEAHDPAAFRTHLLSVIPVTRQAAGIRFSWTAQDPENLTRFTLVQEWESLAQQQGYIAWRQETGDLAQFLGFLNGTPRIEVREVFDR